jgi:hypothetical protein
MPYLNIPASYAPKLSKPVLKKGALQFKCNLDGKDKSAAYIVVYRFNDRLPGDFNNAENIYGIYRLNGRRQIIVVDKTIEKGKKYTYSASTLNAQYSESNLSNHRAVEVESDRLKKAK